jgi:aspartyl-tRNA(Asn)/glutamyl-tRNA(Gln) amidotransferase subunit C
MKVDDALIDNLAHLARLQFSDEEKAELKKDLQSMIAFVEKLNEIDTTGVKPLLHMSSEVNILRDDEVKNSITHEEALLNAPIPGKEFFKVPKVIKR